MQRMSASFRARVTLPGSASSQGQGPRACLADYSKYQVAGTQPPTFCPDNHQTSRISHHRTSFYLFRYLLGRIGGCKVVYHSLSRLVRDLQAPQAQPPISLFPPTLLCNFV